MSILRRLFDRQDQKAVMVPLYNAIVARGRDKHWYLAGQVPDTIDGRFDMIAAITALVLLRLEGEADRAQQSVWLTELFVTDMDGQLREIGIGDMMVGKHIGGMMGALGGRISAFRAALAGEQDLGKVVRRNIYRDAPPNAEAPAYVTERLRSFATALFTIDGDAIVAGRLP